MERRKAIKTAAAASLTLLAGATGIALNAGIVGASGPGAVGNLQPVTSKSAAAATVSADGTTANTVPGAPSIRPTNGAPITTSSASSYRTGEHGDDGDHHYEGAADDD